MIELLEYNDTHGHSYFTKWFDDLDESTATKVTAALVRLEQGNFSNVKGVGNGVFEYRINFGPGYRLYFGKDGEHIVILLSGGTKKLQQRDIATAQIRWSDYKHRKIKGDVKWH